MIYLASADKARTTAPEIAEQMGLSVHYLRQVLRELTRVRLVTSSPARTGGYRLARSADEITVLEIVETMEGPMVVAECVLGRGPCHWADVCPMHLLWSGALQAMANGLAQGSLASLASIDRALLENRFRIPEDVRHRRGQADRP